MNLEPIDTSTTAGKAEVMRLAAEGRRVAQRSNSYEEKFIEQDRPDWNWRVSEYAIIIENVEPREVWVLVNKFGQCFDVSGVEGRLNASPVATVARYIRADLAGEGFK